MSPELQRLLEALDRKLNSPLEEKTQRAATFERLLSDALAVVQKQAARNLSTLCVTAIDNSCARGADRHRLHRTRKYPSVPWPESAGALWPGCACIQSGRGAF